MAVRPFEMNIPTVNQLCVYEYKLLYQLVVIALCDWKSGF